MSAQAHPAIAQALREGRAVLTEPEAAQVLAAYGIRQPREAVATTEADAVEAARRLGFPVVLKLCSPDVLHKTEAGGVKLGLGDADQVRRAFEELRAIAAARGARFSGVLVQEQVAGDVEVIVGARHDPTFGPVVLVGLGGVLAELLKDTALRLAPVSPDAARRMLAELSGYQLLTGFRGRPAVDLDALAGLIATVSRLASELPLAELDLNPVILKAGGRGAVAVDRRLILRDPAPEAVSQAPGDAREAVRRLLSPSSVAVVGASRDLAKVGGRLINFLTRHDYPGKIFAVNPRGEAIGPIPTVKSVQELPEPVDLACIVVPAEACEETIRACGARGVSSAIIFTSGFAEAGNDAAERRLVEAGRAAGVRFCGPNCLGVLNPEARFFASFSGALNMPPLAGGEIAYVSQSGALGGSFLTRLWDRGIAVSRFVSVGNQADLDMADYVDALVDDPAAKVIVLFLEGVVDGRKLCRALARAREAGKPVVVYKAGRTREGAAAIRSHTGALAGDDAVYSAALRQSGALRVADMSALFEAAVALAWQPPPRGPRVGIISTSGGACGILADECHRYGFEVPELPEATRKRVEAEIPGFGVSRNPIDVTAQMLARPSMFRSTLGILAEEPGIDAILLMLTTLTDPLAEQVAEDVAAAVRGLTKPVLMGWIVTPSLARKGMARIIEAKIPLYDSPERVVLALHALAEWQRGRA
ncbi:MAG: acetate--CoA ligase family protein [Candidatus Rokubacteria bacterium]|nr:acetate--CoA ligase family protein [Candidatus Rokubacteria bacterium]